MCYTGPELPKANRVATESVRVVKVTMLFAKCRLFVEGPVKLAVEWVLTRDKHVKKGYISEGLDGG